MYIIRQKGRSQPAILDEGVDELQDMHLLAERHILTGLKEGGWLQGEIEEMLQQRVAALFMPHGVRLRRLLHCGHVLQWILMFVINNIETLSTNGDLRPFFVPRAQVSSA